MLAGLGCRTANRYTRTCSQSNRTERDTYGLVSANRHPHSDIHGLASANRHANRYHAADPYRNADRATHRYQHAGRADEHAFADVHADGVHA